MKKFALASLLAFSAMTAHAAAPELVINGNFESSDMSAWTEADAETRVFADGPTGRYYSVSASADITTVLTQTIQTEAGKAYNFSFDFTAAASGSQYFGVMFGDAQILSLGGQGSEWVRYDFNNLIANGNSTVITFAMTNAGLPTGLDNISVSLASPAPIPEPETYAMMLAGLGLLGFMAKRRKAA